MKRIRITGRGLYGAGGKEIPIGTELEVKAIPAGWAKRCQVIGDKAGKKMVVNPAGKPEEGEGENPAVAAGAGSAKAKGK